MTELYYIGPEDERNITIYSGEDSVPELRFESFDPASDPRYYCSAYSDAWLAAHGDLENFSPLFYLNRAKKHYLIDSEAVMRAYHGSCCAGLLDMDPLKEMNADWGWISLLYLGREYVHRGCGIQLLKKAEQRALNRNKHFLRLNASENNKAALAFYSKHGFRKISSEVNDRGRLWLLEKKL